MHTDQLSDLDIEYEICGHAMKKVEIKFTVSKPIEAVFGLISDIPNYSNWVPANSNFFIETKMTTDGAIGLGSTYIDRLRGFVTSFGEIVRYSPPYEIELFEKKTFFGIKLFEANFSYSLKTVEGNTEVSHEATASPCGIFKIISPINSLIVNSERKLTCKATKSVLEG